MHPEALAWVAKVARAQGPFRSVVDAGGRDVNGSPRLLFPAARYVAIDLHDGPGVDLVADVTRWRPEEPFDAMVCCEVLEHVPNPAEFIATAHAALRPDGWLFLTAACPPRPAHSAIDGGPLHPGEFYRNINPDQLAGWLAGWDVTIEVHDDRGDVYAAARRA